MIPSRIASWVLLVAAAVAPWVAGARARSPGVLWILGGAMVLAFLLVTVERVSERRGLRLSRKAVWPVGFLLVCVAWWLFAPEPEFATRFSAEHWSFVEKWNPAGQLQFPRAERLFFLGSLLLGFCAAVDLGREVFFRRAACWTIGITGLLVSAYSVGQRWFGLPPAGWLYTSGGLDAYSSVFFNYSASAACLNMAWPWLLFGYWEKFGKYRWLVGLLTLAFVAAALSCWPAASGWGVAGLLLAGGMVGIAFKDKTWVSPRLILVLIGALFCTAFVAQTVAIYEMQGSQRDSWLSAEDTLMRAEARDAQLRELAASRSDHMVSSRAPALPSVWLAGARMAADHPLIGKGPGSWVRESTLYSNDPLVNTFFHMRQFAHHDLLQTAAEWGGLAAVAWLWLWVGGFHRAARSTLTGRPEDLGPMLSLVAVALHSLVHFPLQVPALQLWTALALALTWSRRMKVPPLQE